MLRPLLQESVRSLSTLVVSSIDKNRNMVRTDIFLLDSALYTPSSKSVGIWGGRGTIPHPRTYRSCFAKIFLNMGQGTLYPLSYAADSEGRSEESFGVLQAPT
jgi:hypothetical protein